MSEAVESSPMPLRPYQRLHAELTEMIAVTEPGGQLPSEPDLSRKMGVSRATLREAMRSFEVQGLIRRRQGKGTFVVGHKQVIESGLEVLESIETLANKIQLNVSMGALKILEISANLDQAKALDVPEGSRLLQIARVILAEQRPVSYLVDVLPLNILSPEELNNGFTGSVLDFLLRRGEINLANSRTDIQAVAATPDIARALEVQRREVLLLFIARLFTETGRVIDYSSSYFLPGYFHFHIVRKVESTGG